MSSQLCFNVCIYMFIVIIRVRVNPNAYGTCSVIYQIVFIWLNMLNNTEAWMLLIGVKIPAGQCEVFSWLEAVISVNRSKYKRTLQGIILQQSCLLRLQCYVRVCWRISVRAKTNSREIYTLSVERETPTYSSVTWIQDTIHTHSDGKARCGV